MIVNTRGICQPSRRPASLCVIGARYSMSADIYLEDISQDQDSGQVIRQWNFEKTISCFVVPIKSISKLGFSSEEKWNYRLDQNVYLGMFSGEKIPTSAKVTNIKNGLENLFFEDYPPQPPTIFDVAGSNIRVDSSGSVIEYDTFLNKSQVQDWKEDIGGDEIG